MFSIIRQIYTIIYAYVNFGYVGNNNMGKKENKEFIWVRKDLMQVLKKFYVANCFSSSISVSFLIGWFWWWQIRACIKHIQY